MCDVCSGTGGGIRYRWCRQSREAASEARDAGGELLVSEAIRSVTRSTGKTMAGPGAGGAGSGRVRGIRAAGSACPTRRPERRLAPTSTLICRVVPHTDKQRLLYAKMKGVRDARLIVYIMTGQWLGACRRRGVTCRSHSSAETKSAGMLFGPHVKTSSYRDFTPNEVWISISCLGTRGCNVGPLHPNVTYGI